MFRPLILLSVLALLLPACSNSSDCGCAEVEAGQGDDAIYRIAVATSDTCAP